MSAFLSSTAYLSLPRAPKTWIVEDLLPTSGLLNIWGTAKSGKSFAALQLAVAVSTDAPSFLSLPIHTHGPVCYLQADTPRGLFCTHYLDRIAAQYDISGIFHADQEMIPYPFSILGDGGVWLRKALAAMTPSPVVLIIDTLRDIHSGDENDSSVMRNVMSALVAASHVIAPSPALVLLSHARKANPQTPDAGEDITEGNRGSNAVAGRTDALLRVGNTIRGVASLTYKSRTANETTLRVTRDAVGFWRLVCPEDAFLIAQVQRDYPGESRSAQAQRLVTLTGAGSVSSWVRRLDELG